LPGATPCSRLITRRLIERFLRQLVLASPGSKPLHQGTVRERKVLELIAHGLSNASSRCGST
jgi:ATP/maltotriose-dependent transcriptional regulator MalT